MSAHDVLNQLRDIHLPAEPSWWPPAPGWWMLMILILVAMTWLSRVLMRTWRRWRRRRRVLNLFNVLCRQLQTGKDRQVILAEMSKLLKRVALLLGQPEAAALCGPAWLRWLDQRGKCVEFSEGAGQILLHGPYRRYCDEDLDSLVALVRRWLRRNV